LDSYLEELKDRIVKAFNPLKIIFLVHMLGIMNSKGTINTRIASKLSNQFSLLMETFHTQSNSLSIFDSRLFRSMLDILLCALKCGVLHLDLRLDSRFLISSGTRMLGF